MIGPANPLIIGADEKAKLLRLRELAAKHPVDMPALIERIKTHDGKRLHMRQMRKQSVSLPVAYVVTYSIETGHPCGPARHMSMSSSIEGRMPIPEAVWMVCEELGFIGGFDACQRVWIEELEHRGRAVNVVQAVSATLAGQDEPRAH